MAKQAIRLTFTFVNLNTPKEVELQLQKILLQKLRTQCSEKKGGAGFPV